METPLVTILLPFYHAHDTLYRAVESIVQQTLRDWKLILIDNNADAASLQVADVWINRDPRIMLIREPRQGIAYALNAGLSIVNTPYVARMDADDVSFPERLQMQLDFLEQHSDIGLVATACKFESSVENAEGYREFVRWQNNLVMYEQHYINRFIESPVAHPSVLFRSDLVQRFGGYSEANIPEDYELWLRWMEQSVKFHKLPNELLIWNDNVARLSRTHANYSGDAFYETKMKFLARWLAQLEPSKRLVVCGTGKAARSRAALLKQNGVTVHAFTDVKQRGVASHEFVPVEAIGNDQNLFYINFISKRNVRDDVRQLFVSRGLVEGIDFILAA